MTTPQSVSESYSEYEIHDKNMSKSLYLRFMGVPCYSEQTKKLFNGEYILKNVIMRFNKFGLLHGGQDMDGEDQPAIEAGNGAHVEWWKDGMPHREDGPAVISEYGNWEEFWFEGNLVKIRCLGSINLAASKEIPIAHIEGGKRNG